MATKILDSIKKLLGIEAVDTAFDEELIMHINSVFLTLNQLGVGPSETFSMTDSDTEWSEFLDLATDLEAVKPYVYIRTRLLFDPPQNSFLVAAFEKQIQELEWRLQLQKEPYTLTAEAAAEAVEDEEII